MKRVIIESPYQGAGLLQSTYQVYLHKCLLDSLNRGEAPFASHGFYTQVLDDDDPKERALGMKSGMAWYGCADLVAVYMDHGISPGMQAGIDFAIGLGIPIEERRLRCQYTVSESRI